MKTLSRCYAIGSLIVAMCVADGPILGLLLVAANLGIAVVLNNYAEKKCKD